MAGRKHRTRSQLFAAIVFELLVMAILIIVLQPKLAGNPKTSGKASQSSSPTREMGGDGLWAATSLVADDWHVATAVQSPRPLNRWTTSSQVAPLSIDLPVVHGSTLVPSGP